MCGIAGYCHSRPEKFQRESLISMLKCMAHRGPDDQGTYYDGSRIALGHRRLSILDLSSAGHQPMQFGNLLLVFNGEIYNFQAIRAELAKLGHSFISHTDSEVVLHAFTEWGKACLSRFVGMWAFVIYDKSNNTLFAARDRFGVKPFYYFWDQNTFAFSSEIRPLLLDFAPRKVNQEILAMYILANVTDHSETTFFQDILQLAPGCYLQLDLSSFTLVLEKYYSLPTELHFTETAQGFIDQLTSSVNYHLISDVPVGTCLSGGLDSSVIASLAAEFSRQRGQPKFSAITAKSELPENDESHFAEMVALSAGLQWHVTSPTQDDFSEHIENCIWVQEEPFGGPSVFMQYWVMKKAHEIGLKVMLDGQGGDELLLGYERYYISFFWEILKSGEYSTLISEVKEAARNSKMSFWSLLQYAVYFLFPSIRAWHFRYRASFFRKDLFKYIQDYIHRMSACFFSLPLIQRFEIDFNPLPHLLRYEDRNSMAHSIEARVPYVDVNCVESALRLASDQKIRRGFTKYPLRQLADKILPKEIAWRRVKFGFEAPSAKWLSGHQQKIRETLHKSALLDFITCGKMPPVEEIDKDLQWRLYNLAVWERQHNITQ